MSLIDFALGKKETDETISSLQPQQIEKTTWRGRLIKFINFFCYIPCKIYQLFSRIFGSAPASQKSQLRLPPKTQAPKLASSQIEKSDSPPSHGKPIEAVKKEMIVEKSVGDQILDYIQSPEKRGTLADLLPPSGGIINTKLGDILVSLSFDLQKYQSCAKTLNRLLKFLTQDARNGDQAVQKALTLQNNPGEEVKGEKLKNGFPQNTPLALLIKMQNQDGAIEIVKVYSEQDLLFPNPLGNTALHLAVGTGQLEVAKAILARAEELGVKEKLLAARNCLEMTAQDIYKHLKNFGRPKIEDFFSGCSALYFGGEEGNKANIGSVRMAVILKEIRGGPAPEEFFS